MDPLSAENDMSHTIPDLYKLTPKIIMNTDNLNSNEIEMGTNNQCHITTANSTIRV